ncbi:hypothetical protein LCGC14_2363070 [marine sediment metagenome]|uniref:Uncharacterized protein n=1 Tax=marine sediment metagenome TaxID=412755 RepID=A0A0F9F0T3_9ZZZZ
MEDADRVGTKVHHDRLDVETTDLAIHRGEPVDVAGDLLGLRTRHPDGASQWGRIGGSFDHLPQETVKVRFGHLVSLFQGPGRDRVGSAGSRRPGSRIYLCGDSYRGGDGPFVWCSRAHRGPHPISHPGHSS